MVIQTTLTKLAAAGFIAATALPLIAAQSDVPLPPPRPHDEQTYGGFAGQQAAEYCIRAVENNSGAFTEKEKGVHRIICLTAFLAGVMWYEGKDPATYLPPAETESPESPK